MRTIWHSLAWKEWHEHKWKLASLVCILLSATGSSMLLSDRDRLGLAYGLLFMCIVPLAVFIGLGTAANERSRGTLPFLQSLPVPMWQVALTKLLMGLVTIVVPVILTVLWFYIWRRAFALLGIEHRDLLHLMQDNMGRIHLGSWYLDVAVFCAGIAVSLFIWSAATGVNRKDEISAGAIALSVMFGWSMFLWLALWLVALRTNEGVIVTSPDEPLISWLVAITLALIPGAPAVFISGSELSDHQFAVAEVITATVHLLLAWSYVRRYGQIAEREIVSPRTAVRDSRRYDWLAPPRHSPFTALAWKQVRESGPIVVAGLTLTVGVSLLMFVINRNEANLSHLYTAVAASLGSGTALVVGIGLVLNDLSPQLNTFWRSRPINPNLLFWTKFAVGVGIILAALYFPVAIFAAFGTQVAFDPEAVILVPAIQVAAFAAGVAMTALVRHAVYAAILSIAAIYLGVFTVLLAWLAAGLLGLVERRPNWWEPSETPQVAAGLLTTLVVSTLVAWLAVRYDWGRKSRY